MELLAFKFNCEQAMIIRDALGEMPYDSVKDIIEQMDKTVFDHVLGENDVKEKKEAKPSQKIKIAPWGLKKDGKIGRAHV